MGLAYLATETMRIVTFICILAFALAEAAGALKNADHWAYQPPLPQDLPTVKSDWVRNPIDQFIAKRLADQGLKPNPLADRRTLIRRITFALTGLPPTPKEVDDFLKSDEELAIEHVVWRLLRSPRYGERWARHWLDVVRFSESQGFERDKIRPDAYHYRDYVIHSFNTDKPYDRFVREQIAGDVIKPITTERIVATGFLVAGPWDEVGNSQKSNVMRMRVREEEVEDIISAVGQTFLGVTINCARCHDHKFDPIPQTDYYAVKAVFEGVFHGTRTYLDPKTVANRESDERRLRAELSKAQQRHRELKEKAIAKLDSKKAAGDSNVRPYLRWTFDGTNLDEMRGLEGHLRRGAKIEKGRLILDGKDDHLESLPIGKDINEKTLEGWVKLDGLTQRRGAIVSLYRPAGHVFDAIVYAERRPFMWMAGSDYFKRTIDLNAPKETDDKGLIHMAISYAADNSVAVYRNGFLLGKYTPKNPVQEFKHGEARVLIGKRTASGNLKGEVEEVRVYDRALSGKEILSSYQRGPILYSWPQMIKALPKREGEEFIEVGGRVNRLAKELKKARERPLVYAAKPRKPEPTYFLARGDITKKQDVMNPRALQGFRSLDSELGLLPNSPDADRRLRFANWLTHPDNPLLARVLVNRVWHYHFGRGLVDTPSDFGVSGSRPSHPELLDWLALRFMKDGWSIKRLHSLILTSATFLQSSEARKDALAMDADNRLLWRVMPKRLEAEAVRDSMLAISGQLNVAEVGGPGYQPFDLEINNTHFYHTRDKIGPEYNRRTIYRIGVQSLREPLLDSLDCPDLSTKTPVRGTTTTPIQALALMNDPFVQRQAKFFAERLSNQYGEDHAQSAVQAYQLALGRYPELAEIKRATKHINTHGLDQFCWALLNANEFIYVR